MGPFKDIPMPLYYFLRENFAFPREAGNELNVGKGLHFSGLILSVIFKKVESWKRKDFSWHFLLQIQTLPGSPIQTEQDRQPVSQEDSAGSSATPNMPKSYRES